ncbi:hypothetical protein PS662_03095 [Pseudomonas fluorescens]|uniref:Uncharacterized protein n=1 Tax=Pseudomonas fluorescens TaxID=294 RepID=A0A5E6TYW2_PSEFL|nr:hypothetical protein PS662_00032 [Pseudomonas fluorescens]VVM96143.1 hypothetical protein PS662_03095 [Pseudomonas fluorescens]
MRVILINVDAAKEALSAPTGQKGVNRETTPL